MNTPVITISSRTPHEPYYFLREFSASCSRQHIEPIFLEGEWKGLLSKPKLLLKHLENCPPTKYTIFTDCWDIIFTAPVHEILERYLSFNVPIVFNAERSCFPRGDLAEQFPKCDSPYRFLNSGFFVGETEAIINMLRSMRLEELKDDFTRPDGSKHEPNDQENYQLWYLSNQDKARLDTTACICQSLHASLPDEFEFVIAGQLVRSLLTMNCPLVFHGNGSGKEWLKKIITALEL